jgi:hypothetical protein
MEKRCKNINYFKEKRRGKEIDNGKEEIEGK